MRRPALPLLFAAFALAAGCPAPEPVSFINALLPDATLGHPYAAAVRAVGGTAPLRFDATGVPTGLIFDATGHLEGTPDREGDVSLQVTVTDAKGESAQSTFRFNVFPAPQWLNRVLPEATVGESYSATLVVLGGKPPITVVETSGTLPPGLILGQPSLTILGRPMVPGITQMTFTATDANGASASVATALTVRPPLTVHTSSVPEGYPGRPYSAALTADSGIPPYQWSVIAGALPDGLVLATDGTISGTPTVSGTALVTFQVQDAGGRTASDAIYFTILSPPSISNTPCRDGYVAEAYWTQWPITGGKWPYSWTLASGALPGGLLLSSQTGGIYGDPAAAGLSSFTLRVTDANGVFTSASCQLRIYDFLAITTASPLPDLTAGAPASGNIAVAGGKAPLAWSATGTLPTGLYVDGDTGAYAGNIGTNAGNGQVWVFDVDVSDANTRTARKTFQVTTWRVPVVDTTSLVDATEDAPYQAGLQAHNGKAPLVYAVSGLPSGLSVDAATGVISGTPPLGSLGSYPLSVTVTDAGGRAGTASLTLVVQPGTPPIIGVRPAFGTVTGGTRVTLTGAHLSGATVTLGGRAVPVTVAPDGASLGFTTPPADGPGAVAIRVTTGARSAAASFLYTLERTVDPDRSAADWTPAFRIRTHPAPELYAAYDADNLYVGLSGMAPAESGAVVLLSVDTGQSRSVLVPLPPAGFTELRFPWTALYPDHASPPPDARVSLAARFMDPTRDRADEAPPEDAAEVDVRLSP